MSVSGLINDLGVITLVCIVDLHFFLTYKAYKNVAAMLVVIIIIKKTLRKIMIVFYSRPTIVKLQY